MDNEIRARFTNFMASPLSRWRPWVTPDGKSPQREFMQAAATHRARIFRAGNRCGKSEGAAYDHSIMCYGMHPWFPKSGKPLKGWVVGLDWSTVGGVLFGKFKKFIGKDCQISYVRRMAPEIPSRITFPNGSTIDFKSAEAARDKFAGADLDFAWIDEEIPYELVEEIRARLIDRGGLLSVTLTPVSRQPWILDLESENFKGVPTTKVVRASMLDAAAAGILDEQAVQAYLSTLPERQRRVREAGDWANLEGLVYQSFSRATHCVKPVGHTLVDSTGRFVAPWPLPREWPRFVGMDFGFSVPSAVVQIAVDPYRQNWYVERCFYTSGVRITQWSQLLRAELPKLECPIVADWDAMERAELAAVGVATSRARKEVVPGIESVERALMPPLEGDGTPRLKFVLFPDQDAPTHPLTGRTDAYHLVWELERYRYKEKKEKGPDFKDEPLKRDDHSCDALRYVVHFLERRTLGGAPTLPIVPVKENPFTDATPPNPWPKKT